MDNASKALLMAGGTLIAILIISLTMYTLTTIRMYSENSSSLTKSSQDEAFNRYFVYQNGNISWCDAYNLVRKVKDINENLNLSDEITVKYQGTVIANSSLDNLASQIESEGYENVIREYSYEYSYGSDGRINEIRIYN